ncbi:MAG: pyridoxamine 5'-phosphate oxidase family protein [Actinobacteria bacterium]|nr:pyridoxamine 5'-phosphate oxidase family protein [Actinomycetota bacterium]
MDAIADGTGRKLVVLDRAECLRLLATVPVGRLIFTVGALPTVRMMNFVMTGEVIVLRTAADTTTARKAAGSVVAFEADQVDLAARSGWSVTVTGWAMLVTDPQAITSYSALPLVPWAPGERDQFVTIKTEVVYGRRVLAA